MSNTAKHTTHHAKQPHETHETTVEEPAEHDGVNPLNPPGGYIPPAMGGALSVYQMTSVVTASLTAWEYYHHKMIH